MKIIFFKSKYRVVDNLIFVLGIFDYCNHLSIFCHIFAYGNFYKFGIFLRNSIQFRKNTNSIHVFKT